MKNNRPKEFWNDVYSILVEDAGASEKERDSFLYHAADFTEWRFQGKLGFGGKLRNNYNRGGVPYIDCYSEDENDERNAIIENTNKKLQKVYNHYFVLNKV